MKKLIIATFVGALILFLWQFLSWSKLNIHDSQLAYTEAGEEVIACMSEHLTEGDYMVPRLPADASDDEVAAYMQSQEGNPWALVSYRESFSTNMGMNMIRAYAADLIAVFLFCWILLHFRSLDLLTALKVSIAVGVIGYLMLSYMKGVWFDLLTLPDLIDQIVQWALVGLWLGYWLPRGLDTKS